MQFSICAQLNDSHHLLEERFYGNDRKKKNLAHLVTSVVVFFRIRVISHQWNFVVNGIHCKLHTTSTQNPNHKGRKFKLHLRIKIPVRSTSVESQEQGLFSREKKHKPPKPWIPASHSPVANESSYRKTHLSTERKAKGEVNRSRKKGEGEREDWKRSDKKALPCKRRELSGASPGQLPMSPSSVGRKTTDAHSQKGKGRSSRRQSKKGRETKPRLQRHTLRTRQQQ